MRQHTIGGIPIRVSALRQWLGAVHLVDGVEYCAGVLEQFAVGWVIRRLDAMPSRADVVCAYRPAAELAAITRLAVELGAHTMWVQGGVLPEDARHIADAAGMRVVESVSIADAARELAAEG